jgi:hypothetical protein
VRKADDGQTVSARVGGLSGTTLWRGASRACLEGVVLLAAVGTGGCAVSGSVACHADEKRLVSETLYFGTAKPGGVVGAADI